MAWRDQLREGSFRGAAFLIERAEGQLGRRTVVHQFPLRDDPEIEDLGAEAREFSIEAFVLGADYMTGRDALLAALEQPGPGTLVHPYYGEITVSVAGRARYSESTREGGMVRVSIPFVRFKANSYPLAQLSTPAVVAAAVERTSATLTTVVADEFSVKDRAAFVSEAASNIVQSGIDQLTGLVRTITTVPERLTRFVDLAQQAGGAVASLIVAPATLVLSLRTLVSQLRTAADQPSSALRALSGLFSFGSDLPTVPRTTASRIAQGDNQAALVMLVRTLAVMEAVQASSQIRFASLDEARLVREQLIGEIDSLVELATDDGLYFALVDVRSAMARDISVRGVDLARLITIELPDSVPALALSWRLYADATREADIVTRNRLDNPLFVPARRALEVLSDA